MPQALTQTNNVVRFDRRRGRQPNPSTITRKNGQFPVALIAGGPADIAREIRDRLASKVGIHAKYHLDWEKSRDWQKPIPADVDLIIHLKDMAGHSGYYALKSAAQRSGVLMVCTTRKWARMYQALWRYGARKAEVPVEVASTAILTTPSGEEITEPEAKPLVADRPEVKITAPKVDVEIPQATEVRRGSMRQETGALVAMLHRLVMEDGISILITPRGIQIDPEPVAH